MPALAQLGRRGRSGSAWEFLFGIQMRVAIASILTVIATELVDTHVYHWWSHGAGEMKHQWTRVLIPNAFSLPVDSVLFPMIAFNGIISADAMFQMFGTDLLVKAVTTILVFWTIYLVPEKPIYDDPLESVRSIEKLKALERSPGSPFGLG